MRQKEFTLSTSKGFAHLILLFIIVLAAIGGIVYWNINKSNSSNGNGYKLVFNNTYVTPPPTESSSPTSTIKPQDAPNQYVLYYAVYKDTHGIFYANESTTRMDPYQGSFSYPKEPNKPWSEYADFRELKDIKIIKTQGVLSDLQPPILMNNNYAYVSINVIPDRSDLINSSNQILKIDLDKFSATSIWSNQIGSTKYKNAGGVVYLENNYENKYLVGSIGTCYWCEGREAGKIILNVVTKNEIYKEGIGNLKITLLDKTFSYQKLSAFKEKCDSPEDYGCDNGYRTVMKPSGQVYTEALP